MHKTFEFVTIAAATLFTVGLAGCNSTPEQEVAVTPVPSATVEPSAQPTATPIQIPQPTLVPEPSPAPTPDYGPMPDYDYVIPFTQEDWEVPAPDFLTEEQVILYKQAYKFYGIYAYDTHYMDREFPVGSPPPARTIYRIDLHTTIYKSYGYFQYWDTFCSVYHTLFTNEKFEEDVMKPDQSGYPHFMDRDGITWYQDYEKGGNIGYSRERWPETFELLESSPNKIVFRVTCYYRDPANDEWAEIRGIFSSYYDSYDVIMEKEDGKWKFSQFDVPY